MTKLLDYLESCPRWFILATAIFLTVVLGLINFFIGAELSFSVFYLLPVSLASWYTGLRTGIVIAVLCALTWRAAETLAGAHFSHPLIPFWNMLVRLGFFVTTAYLIAALRTAFTAEQRLARIDMLTGAINRRQFYALAEQEIRRSGRYRRAFCAAYIDLDNFKQVNDRLGHQSGDTLLCAVVETLHSRLRATDIVSRLGGDEFALLLPETSTAAAQELITRLNEHLLSCMHSNDWPVTFSIGVVAFNNPPADVDQMIKRMDAVMYEVKNGGKNAISFHAEA